MENINKNVQVVIAHYSEDISYLDKICYPFVLLSNHSIQSNTIPNRGNEALLYIKYIIDNYNNLPNYVMFLHGHRTSWAHRDIPSEEIVQNTTFNSDYCDLDGFYVNIESEMKKLLYILSHVKAYLQPFIPFNIFQKKYFKLYLKAEFYVSKKAIKQYSLNDYVTLYEGLMAFTKISGWDIGFLMEFLWSYIFTKKIISNSPHIISNLGRTYK